MYSEKFIITSPVCSLEREGLVKMTPQRTWHSLCSSPTQCCFSHMHYSTQPPPFPQGIKQLFLQQSVSRHPLQPGTEGGAATLSNEIGPVHTQVSASGPAVLSSAV